MNDFKFLCNKSELIEKKGKYFLIDEVDVAVFKINDEIFALNNVCPHHHANNMFEGFIEEKFLLCPNHGWRFDFKTGLKEGKLKGLDVYETKVIEDKIYIKVYKKEFKW